MSGSSLCQISFVHLHFQAILIKSSLYCWSNLENYVSFVISEIRHHHPQLFLSTSLLPTKISINRLCIVWDSIVFGGLSWFCTYVYILCWGISLLCLFLLFGASQILYCFKKSSTLFLLVNLFYTIFCNLHIYFQIKTWVHSSSNAAWILFWQHHLS